MRRWLAIAMLAGCYRASDVATCSVRCGAAGECPTGMSCNGARVCSTGGELCTIPDAFVTPTADARACFGGTTAAALVTVCPPILPLAGKILGNDIDTDTNCDFLVSNDTYCVIAGLTITLASTVHVTGTKPLIIVAADTMLLLRNAELDSIGSYPGASAAGADLQCDVSTNGGSDSARAGGGAGGSFTTSGAVGGNTSFAGQPGMVHVATTIAGGCRGSTGGQGDAAAGGAPGGGGGGLYLIAGTSIDIEGKINVSGQGGGAGAQTTNPPSSGGGGGGGGSGGFVAFDSKLVQIGLQSIILANGGGGGGAGGYSNDGGLGATPTTLVVDQYSSPASGGSSGGNGGAGGTGYALDRAAYSGVDGGAGGGGGGGAGAVTIFATSMSIGDTSQISPRPAP